MGQQAKPFLGVLESAFQNIQADAERKEAFKAIIMNRQEFLKRIDVIYGLAEGQFLKYMQPDRSLLDLPEWVATVRFYVRLLLPIRNFIIGPIKAEFMKEVRSADIIKFLEISDEGEVEIGTVMDYVEKLPEKRRVEA
ncbi:MAG: hypothetical protein ACUVQY_08340 [Thermoproteota archaeon]